MKGLTRAGVVAVAMATVIGLGGALGVAQDKEAIIKERRATMKHQGDNFKAISDFLKGEGGVDQATALAKAQELLTIAPKIPSLFPAGTSLTDFPGKTGAKPDIWKEPDKFKAVIPVLEGEEHKLVDAIKSGDKAAIGAQLGATGKNGCGACHTPFREKLT